MRHQIKLLLTVFVLLVNSFTLLAQEKNTITGSVKDDAGMALTGATVSEKGTKNSVLTGRNGEFSIKVSKNATLVISFVGFKVLEVTADESAPMSISLQAGGQQLEEVVVTSLGQTKKQRALGYAQTTVKSDAIVKTAPTNFATALYGKAPGVKISASPGGPTSGVNIQVRGLNSISFSSNPLIVMDGIPIRNGEFKNNDYWNDQRLRSNGLVDLNPEDIDNISILKGASAAALYGSSAANGVILITTKSGKGRKGFSVDFSANTFIDKVAYLPRYQNVRGTGYPVQYGVFSSDANGFAHQTLNGTDYRTMVAGSINFGPKFDGQPILGWDGVVRPYSAQTNNYAALFQTAHNNTENIAIMNNTENATTRFSITHQHTEGVSLGSRNERVAASLNSSLKLGKRNTLDLMVNYTYQNIHNRPYSVDRMINNFTGMIGRFDNGDWYLNKYQTSKGYRFVTGGGQSLTPSENISYGNYRGDILDFIWRVKRNELDEYSNRLISSVTDNWEIVKNLKLRTRISTDYTGANSVTKNATEKPIIYGYSGYFGVGNSSYTVLYGDALLSYLYKVNPDINITAMAGYTAQRDKSFSTSVGTNGGLSDENHFDLSASYLTPYSSSGNQLTYITDAIVGTVNADYKNYLFVEGTIRRDRTSKLFNTNNTFVYPSVNSGFVLSDAFQLPKQISYAKLRASWGVVGSYPPIYAAMVAYNPGNLGVQSSGTGSVLTTTIPNSFGNNSLKPEKKNEWEIGLEAKFLNNRLGIDASYYNARIVDQILPLTLPASAGGTSVLTNIGELSNKGFEMAITGNPITKKNFTWDVVLNYTTYQNKVVKLANGATELLHADYDGNAAQLKSIVGQPMGDLYAHPVATNSKGEKLVGSDGLYVVDANKMQKYGNAMPKGSGGLMNSLRYKNFSFDAVIDFMYGGSVMPTGINWMTSRGLTEQSLDHMDAAHGGLSYYLVNGKGVQTSAATGPNGETVYHDGMLLEGVDNNGNKNTNVITQAYYYWNVYNWGGPQYSSSLYNLYIVKNNYIKMRELSLTYTLGTKLAEKIKAKKLQVSVFGRNMFYLYRSIKDIDAEQLTAGSYWVQNVNNAGTNPSTRSYGVMIRASF